MAAQCGMMGVPSVGVLLATVRMTAILDPNKAYAAMLFSKCPSAGLWLAGNDGMEQNGHCHNGLYRDRIRIHSFIPSQPKIRVRGK